MTKKAAGGAGSKPSAEHPDRSGAPDEAAAPGPSAPRTKGRLERLLDGWQGGLLVVLLAASAVVLAVPRAAVPSELPEPLVDQRALAGVIREDHALAQLAEQQGLDLDVRMVGTELRQYNVAAAERREVELSHARRRLLAATGKALATHERDLLALRAYQTSQFLVALRQWQRTGAASGELTELGGDFLETMLRNGWCDGPERTLRADEPVLRVLFKKRWNDVTGADAGAFSLTVDEERLRYGFFLREPWVDRDQSAPTTPLERLRWMATRNRKRLGLIDRIAAVDPAYPAQLARGVVLFRMNQLGPAADAFRQQLETRPDGPYALRAQNYLKATLEGMRETRF